MRHRGHRLCGHPPAIITVDQPAGELSGATLDAVHPQHEIQHRTHYRHQPHQAGPGCGSPGVALVLGHMGSHIDRQGKADGRSDIRPERLQHRQPLIVTAFPECQIQRVSAPCLPSARVRTSSGWQYCVNIAYPPVPRFLQKNQSDQRLCALPSKSLKYALFFWDNHSRHTLYVLPDKAGRRGSRVLSVDHDRRTLAGIRPNSASAAAGHL